MMATGGGSCVVSSGGIALYSGASSSSSNNNNITYHLNGCNVTATGSGTYSAVSSTGVALFSSGSTSFFDNAVAISIIASTTLLETDSPLCCSTSLGLCVRPASPSNFFTGNALLTQACNVSSRLEGQGTQSVLGSIALTFATLSLSNVSVTSTAPTASPVSCLSFVPLSGSVFNGVTVACPIAGWAPGRGPGFISDVYVQRMILNGTSEENVPMAQALLPGLQADAFRSTNESIAKFSAARDACALQLRRWQRDPKAAVVRSVTKSTTDFTSTKSLSLTLASRSDSPQPFRTTFPSSSETPSRPTKHGRCSLDSEPRPLLSFTPLLSATMSSHRVVIEPPRNYRSPLSRILGEQATVGVTAASVTASVVGSSVFSSGAVTRVPIMRSLASSIRCAWVEQELDDHPSYLDLPLQFVSIGDHSKHRYYAGGIVLCGLFVLLWELVCLLCFKMLQGRLHRKVESMLGIGSMLWQGYLVPNVAQATVIVCWHAGGGAAVFASAVVVLLVLVYSVSKWLWVLLPAQFAAQAPPFTVSRSQDGPVKVDYSEDSAAAQAWLRFFGPMFDGTVDPGRMICRVLAMEEVGVGVVLSILAGIKPEHDESCQYTAISMLAVTVLHFLYLLVFRPYRTKLDAMFANINAFLMFCQGAFAVIITVEGLGEGPLLTAFGTLGLSQLLLLFVQLIVGGFYSHMLQARRRILQPEDTADHEGLSKMMLGDDTSDTHLESPLLMAPQGVVESNPLTNSHPFRP